MKKQLLLATVGCLICACGMIVAQSARDDVRAGAAAQADSEFRDKLLVVSVKYPSPYTAVLQEVRVRRLGNKDFFVGKTVELNTEKKTRWAGLTCWVQIDDVSGLWEFSSLAQVRDAYAEMKANTIIFAPSGPGGPNLTVPLGPTSAVIPLSPTPTGPKSVFRTAPKNSVPPPSPLP
jgi:hypothetical protein